MSPGTKSVSRDGGRISQRWEDENSEGRTSPGRPAKKGLSVCSTKRVLLELLVVVVLLLWIFMMAFTMASRLEPCQVTTSVRSDLGNRFDCDSRFSSGLEFAQGVADRFDVD